MVDEYTIWVRRKGAFLLTAESYLSKETVNSTKLHYELNVPVPLKELDDIQRMALDVTLEAGSHRYCQDGSSSYFARNVDVREGLASHLRAVEHSGFRTNNPWRFFQEHFLWLKDYSEKSDYEAVRDSKLAQLPVDVQQMLGIEVTERKLYALDDLLK